MNVYEKIIFAILSLHCLKPYETVIYKIIESFILTATRVILSIIYIKI